MHFLQCINKIHGQGQRGITEESIRNAAHLLNDNALLVKIEVIDMRAKKVCYHHSCRKAYLNKAHRDHDVKDSGFPSKVQINQTAFRSLRVHIESILIEDEGAEFLTSLHKGYITFLGDHDSSYSAQSLSEKNLKATSKVLSSVAISILKNKLLSELA